MDSKVQLQFATGLPYVLLQILHVGGARDVPRGASATVPDAARPFDAHQVPANQGIF